MGLFSRANRSTRRRTSPRPRRSVRTASTRRSSTRCSSAAWRSPRAPTRSSSSRWPTVTTISTTTVDERGRGRESHRRDHECAAAQRGVVGSSELRTARRGGPGDAPRRRRARSRSWPAIRPWRGRRRGANCPTSRSCSSRAAWRSSRPRAAFATAGATPVAPTSRRCARSSWSTVASWRASDAAPGSTASRSSCLLAALAGGIGSWLFRNSSGSQGIAAARHVNLTLKDLPTGWFASDAIELVAVVRSLSAGGQGRSRSRPRTTTPEGERRS